MAKTGPSIPIVISGSSGAGKTTVCQLVHERLPILGYTISATTRPPRPTETSGEAYVFLSETEFKSRRAQGEFLEWEEVHGHLYGTLKNDLDNSTAPGILMDIDPKGSLTVKKYYPNAILIYLKADSTETLVDRLQKRQSDSDESIRRRMERVDKENALMQHFDYAISNKILEDTVNKVIAIIRENITL